MKDTIARCKTAGFTGIARVRARQGTGEIWFVSGAIVATRFGVSRGDEAMARLLGAQDAKIELVARLPHPSGGFEKAHPSSGDLGPALRPNDLLHYCEVHVLTCSLEIESSRGKATAKYRMGELLEIRANDGTDRAVAEMLGWTDGRYRFELPAVEAPAAAASIAPSSPPAATPSPAPARAQPVTPSPAPARAQPVTPSPAPARAQPVTPSPTPARAPSPVAARAQPATPTPAPARAQPVTPSPAPARAQSATPSPVAARAQPVPRPVVRQPAAESRATAKPASEKPALEKPEVAVAAFVADTPAKPAPAPSVPPTPIAAVPIISIGEPGRPSDAPPPVAEAKDTPPVEAAPEPTPAAEPEPAPAAAAAAREIEATVPSSAEPSPPADAPAAAPEVPSQALEPAPGPRESLDSLAFAPKRRSSALGWIIALLLVLAAGAYYALYVKRLG